MPDQAMVALVLPSGVLAVTFKEACVLAASARRITARACSCSPYCRAAIQAGQDHLVALLVCTRSERTVGGRSRAAEVSQSSDRLLSLNSRYKDGKHCLGL